MLTRSDKPGFTMSSTRSLKCSKFRGKSSHQLLCNLPFQLLPQCEPSEGLLVEITTIANEYRLRATKAHRNNVQIRAMTENTLMALKGEYSTADAVEEILDQLDLAVVLAAALSEEIIPEIEEIICYVRNVMRGIRNLEKKYKGKQETAESLVCVAAPSTAVSGGVIAGSAYATGCATTVVLGTLSVAAPLALFLCCLGLRNSTQHKRSTVDLSELNSGMNLAAQKLEEHLIALDCLNTHLRDLTSCRKDVNSTNEVTLEDVDRIKRTTSRLQKASELYEDLVKPVTQVGKNQITGLESALKDMRITN